MNIQPINHQQMMYNPYFKSNALKKAKYTVEYIDCAFQRNYPPPAVYRQFLPAQISKNPIKPLLLESTRPMDDLKEVYQLYKEDFSIYHNYLSYKKFKNNLKLEKATVFLLKEEQETAGFYSLAKPNKDTLYICDIDMNPKYRNTRKGKNIIKNCWKNINEIAEANNCSKIGLHVSSAKKNLISLYEKLGFQIIEKKTSKYPTGQKALYMEKVL